MGDRELVGGSVGGSLGGSVVFSVSGSSGATAGAAICKAPPRLGTHGGPLLIKLRSAYPPAPLKAYNPLACAERIPQCIPRKTAFFIGWCGAHTPSAYRSFLSVRACKRVQAEPHIKVTLGRSRKA